MDKFDYIELAGRTNTSDYGKIKERLAEEDILDITGYLLNTCIDVANSLDMFKKEIYYGKNVKKEEIKKLRTESELVFNKDAILEKLDNPVVVDLIHGVVGIYTEAGELVEALVDHLYEGKDLDLVNLAEEVGDVFWYQALIAKHTGKTFEEIQSTNIRKLQNRYPEGFTEKDAINRDLGAERTILEEDKILKENNILKEEKCTM